MRLSYDSTELAAAAVRGPDDPRLLSFEAGGCSVELEIGDGTLWGQVIPGRVCEVTIETWAGERRTATTDESGIFSLETSAGPVRFAVSNGNDVIHTEWVLL